MASYNRIIMIGNLTRDPDYKQLNSGQPVVRLGLASNRQYKNRQTGSMVQEVCFIDVDVFGPQAESCRQYLQKGRGVLVEGRLKLDTWQAPDGQARSKHSIVADRVVFLASGQSDSDTVGQAAEVDSVAAPVQSVKARVSAAKKVVAQTVAQQSDQSDDNDVAFKDEPPFEDDLPF